MDINFIGSLAFYKTALILSFIALIFMGYQYKKISNLLGRVMINYQKLEMARQFNFTNDRGFLDFIILYKCKSYIEIVLESKLKLTRAKIINDEEFNEAVNSITIDIIETLSEEYKNRLKIYISIKKINSYIAEIVYTTMLKYCTQKNLFKMNRKLINDGIIKEDNFKEKRDFDIEK